MTDLDYEQVAADIARRDALDTARAADPLVEAADATVVDTTGLDIDEVVATITELLDEEPRRDRQSLRRSRCGRGRTLEADPWRTHPLLDPLAGLLRLILALFRLRVEGRRTSRRAVHPQRRASLLYRHADHRHGHLSTPAVHGQGEPLKSKLLGAFLSVMGGFPVEQALPIALRCGRHRMCSPLANRS